MELLLWSHGGLDVTGWPASTTLGAEANGLVTSQTGNHMFIHYHRRVTIDTIFSSDC